MWPFSQKPICKLYRGYGGISNGDVHVAVLQTLRDAGLTAEADAFDDHFWGLIEGDNPDAVALAVKRLAERYVRVRVVTL